MLAARPPRRFSLLLLEEGEQYVGDWGASAAWPAGVAGNWSAAPRLPGRLRLASKSLFFEPDDARVPIVRIPFAAVQQLEPLAKGTIAVATMAVTKMKANCADAPYVFEKGPVSLWSFVLAYAGLEEVLPVVQHHMAISRLPYAEREAMLKEAAAACAEEVAFDASRLADFTERIHFNARATALSPLVREAGRLVITDARVYFQPAVDWRGEGTVRSHPLAHIAAVVRRRASLRPTGLELFFLDHPAGGGGGGGWGTPSAFFELGSPEARELAISKLRGQAVLGSGLPGGRPAAVACASILEAEGGWLRRVTTAWQAGRLPNLDYLLFLNLAAGRSFCDLAQWPVAPWVLADYTSDHLDLCNPRSFRDLSKPVGALNKERLAMLRRRYAEMPRDADSPPPFLYGTHYSCPGYIMFWLVRAAPAHLLRLQNGRFDTADRLFGSVAGAWESVTSTAPDVKELIPEFFLQSPAFLTNRLQLALGTRQDGHAVDEVQLPPWASNADDFLAKHRAALESAHVSANLHHWIDLIFGYKQKGAAAEAADNVFHHLTYEGAARDIDAIADPRERAALEAQVNEFGQCPAQLFTEPHPPRCAAPPWPPAARQGSGVSPTAGGTAEDAGALSMALVSAILAAIDGESPAHASGTNMSAATAGRLVRPPELEELDVLVQRQRQQEAAAARTHAAAHMSAGSVAGSQDAPAQQTPQAGDMDTPDQHAARIGQAPSGSGAMSPGGPSAARQQQRDWSGSASRAVAGLASLMGNLTSPSGTVADKGGSSGATSVTSPTARMPSLKSMFARAASGGSATAPKSPSAVAAAQARSSSEAALPQHSAAHLAGQASEPSAQNRAGIGGAVRQAPAAEAPALAEGTQTQRSFTHLTAGRPLVRLPAPVAALAVAAESSAASEQPTLAACQDGFLRVVSCKDGSLVSEQPLGMSALTSLAIVPQAADDAEAALAFAGSADCQVYACHGDTGAPLGTWLAHSDAVSAVDFAGGAPPGSPARLLTASWDGTIKLWELAEGRQPWSAPGSASQAPVVQLGGGGGGVWSAAAGPSGQLVVAGGDDGTVSLWDVRSGARVWQAEASSDYIAGLALLPGEAAALTAAADGRLSLLDIRAGSKPLAAQVAYGAPLSCLLVAGGVATAGSEDGRVHCWQYAAAARWHPDGATSGALLQSAAGGDAAVNALLLLPQPAEAAATTTQMRCGSRLLAGTEDGSLLLYDCRL